MDYYFHWSPFFHLPGPKLNVSYIEVWEIMGGAIFVNISAPARQLTNGTANASVEPGRSDVVRISAVFCGTWAMLDIMDTLHPTHPSRTTRNI